MPLETLDCLFNICLGLQQRKHQRPASLSLVKAIHRSRWIPLTKGQWSLRWRHNDHAGVSNHQPHACLLNRLFRRRSKKTSKLRVTGLCAGNSPGPVNSPHKGPVTRKMFPLDDVIMMSKAFPRHGINTCFGSWYFKGAIKTTQKFLIQ